MVREWIEMSAGVFRTIDNLGRVVLPSDMRRSLGIAEDDEIELSLEKNSIVIRKRIPGCIFCGRKTHLSEFDGKYICSGCFLRLEKVFGKSADVRQGGQE